MSLGEEGNLPSESEPRWRDCEDIAEDDVAVEVTDDKTLSGLWILCGEETGLVGRLSDAGPTVSQYRESSESSDMGEYCKDTSSLNSTTNTEQKIKNQWPV